LAEKDNIIIASFGERQIFFVLFALFEKLKFTSLRFRLRLFEFLREI